MQLPTAAPSATGTPRDQRPGALASDGLPHSLGPSLRCRPTFPMLPCRGKEGLCLRQSRSNCAYSYAPGLRPSARAVSRAAPHRRTLAPDLRASGLLRLWDPRDLRRRKTAHLPAANPA